MLTPESASRKDKRTAQGATLEHRHFAAIASIISCLDKGVTYHPDGIAKFFAMNLTRTNPRFDRARFLRACGVEE